jgi:mannonate dehydratase
MDRRQFFAAASAGSYLAEKRLAAMPAAAAEGPKPTRDLRKGKMKLATQHGYASTPDGLKVMAALGVTHICGNLPSRRLDSKWSVDSLSALRDQVEAAGITLEMLPLPLSSAYITKAEYPAIMAPDMPGVEVPRDKAIEEIAQIILNIGKAGIPSAKYNMSLLGVVRTPRTIGRGGASLSTFRYDEGKQEPPLTEAGKVTQEQYWERIEYFLKRIVPVANEAKVRIACHPQDPMMPPDRGWRGVHTVLDGEGFKKFIEIEASPYHGLNFCQGTVCEGLKNPAKEIFHYIDYFGKRKKIFMVHFRNIKGGFLNFQEVFPDDGDINFIDCIKAYKASGYDGMLMPDHVPNVEGDAGHNQSFAFALGYIRALIQMVDA